MPIKVLSLSLTSGPPESPSTGKIPYSFSAQITVWSDPTNENLFMQRVWDVVLTYIHSTTSVPIPVFPFSIKIAAPFSSTFEYFGHFYRLNRWCKFNRSIQFDQSNVIYNILFCEIGWTKIFDSERITWVSRCGSLSSCVLWIPKWRYNLFTLNKQWAAERTHWSEIKAATQFPWWFPNTLLIRHFD